MHIHYLYPIRRYEWPLIKYVRSSLSWKVVDCWTILVLTGRGIIIFERFIWITISVRFTVTHLSYWTSCDLPIHFLFLVLASTTIILLITFTLWKLYNVIFKYNMKGLPGMIYYNIKTCCINWSQHKMMQLTDHLLFLSNYITNKVLCYYTMYDVTRGSCLSVFIIYIWLVHIKVLRF